MQRLLPMGFDAKDTIERMLYRGYYIEDVGILLFCLVSSQCSNKRKTSNLS